MLADDAGAGCAGADGSFDKFAAAELEDLTADEARVDGAGDDSNGDHGVFDGGTKRPRNCHGEDEGGKCKEDVGESHEPVVGDTAKIAREQADDGAKDRGAYDHDETDGEGDARTP